MMSIGTAPRAITRAGLDLFALALPVSHVPAQLGIAIAVAGWLAEAALNRRWLVRWHALLLPLSLYIGWNLVCAARSPRPAHSLAAVADNEWPLVVMLMMLWTVGDRRTLTRWAWLFLASAAVASGYALWQTVAGVELYRQLPLPAMGGFYRAVGFYRFYLSFAALAMTAFCLAAGFLLERRAGRRWWPAAIMALSLLAVAGTFARSIWLGLAVVVPLGGALRDRRAAIVAAAAMLLLVGAGVLGSSTVRERAASIVDTSRHDTRINLWRTAMAISSDHPVLGIGEDNWDHFFEDYRVRGDYITTCHPHNDYLTVLVNAGVPGLLAFVWMWTVVLRSGLRVWRGAGDERLRAIALGSTLAVVGLLVGGLFQNYYGTFLNALGRWFVVGLVLGAERLAGAGEATAATSTTESS